MKILDNGKLRKFKSIDKRRMCVTFECKGGLLEDFYIAVNKSNKERRIEFKKFLSTITK